MARERILMVVTCATGNGNGDRTGLWLEEFTLPWLGFTGAGCEVTVAGTRGGRVPIDPNSDPEPEQRREWTRAIAQLADTPPLEDVWEQDYDAVFLPGGHGTMFDMPENPLLASVIERAYREGRVVGAVCHGPAALVGCKNAQGGALVQGHRLTCFSNREEREVGKDQTMPFLLESRLQELGAVVDNAEPFTEHVITDGQLVTGQNPRSSRAAAESVIAAMRQTE